MPPASQPVTTSSNANPITSVPGPDEGSDPLASIITQVSQNAPLPTGRGGPARPVKASRRTKKPVPSTSSPPSAAAAAAASSSPTSARSQPVSGSADQNKPLPKADQPQPTTEREGETTAKASDETELQGDKLDKETAPSAPSAEQAKNGKDVRKRKLSSLRKGSRPNANATVKEPKSKSKFALFFQSIFAPCTSSNKLMDVHGDGQGEKGAGKGKSENGDPLQNGKTATDQAKQTKELHSLPITPTPDPSASLAGSSQTQPGVSLPRDETRGVLSGSVVDPGAGAAVVGAAAGGTPTGGSTPTRRGRRNDAGGDLTGGTGSGGESSASDVENQMPTASEGETEEPTDGSGAEDDGEGSFVSEESVSERLIKAGGAGIPIGPDGAPRPLLDELAPIDKGKKCLVLDLDETLVHSSFKQMIHQPDFIVPVEIENQVHNVYVIKRPGVDHFLRQMGELYEVVVFTASLSKYADPVLDMLDRHRVVRHRLFRESCYNHKGNYVKDLSQLGRPIGDTIIIDNSPASYVFHPKNAVPISSWFNDNHDTELTDLVPFLADLANVEDVRGVLDGLLHYDE